jgi:anti-sigma B factor antagonist
MKIHERTLDNVTVLDLEGKFVLGEDRQFKRQVTAYIEGGGRKLIVNLAKLDYMDSSGLGELIAGYMAMKREDGDMKLIHLSNRINQLLVITKLITVFETFDSEAAAISSFTPALASAVV